MIGPLSVLVYTNIPSDFPLIPVYQRFFAPVVSSLSIDSYMVPLNDRVQRDFEQLFYLLGP